jgi:large subunit ribosomal protein L19
MNTELINKFVATTGIAKKKIPDIKVGQTVTVDTLIRDGDKTRIQKFTGLVIAIKGEGTNKTFTVRKISNGYGVEKILPFYSPTVVDIKIKKEEKVRRSKLYFMRDRVGKNSLRVKKGKTNLYIEDEFAHEPIFDEDVAMQ